jgi:hypothetical protein
MFRNRFPCRYCFFVVLFGLLAVNAPSAFSTTYLVSSIADLNTRISGAVAGDTIIVTNGVYTSSSAINITKQGTAAAPITIMAQTIGGVEITGAKGFTLSSPAAYITIQGFKFTHSGSINISSGTSHCRFTRDIVELTIPSTNTTSYIGIAGNDVQIDHCELGNKSTLGEMLDISGSGSQVAERLWVHHNYFHNFSSPGGNGAETIRWGLSGLSLSTGSGLCEYNLFIHCEGENEMISNKSSGNTYRYNTVRDCVGGQISQRHGNDCYYYGNYMTNTDGIRVYGDRHRIFSNYLENNSTGVDMGNGDGDVYNGAPLTSHDRPDDNIVIYNTFINNSVHYEMTGRTGGLGSSNTVVANNIFMNGGSMASISSTAPYTGTWSNNIRWQTSSAGNMPATGYITENPLLVRNAQGVYHLQSGSPAINAGVGSYNFYGVYSTYSFVTNDQDGQLRDANPDIGSDEFSAAPVTAPILTTNDVGIFSGLTNLLSTSPAAQTVAPGQAAVYTVNFTGASQTNSISLSLTGLPANTAAAFSPVSLTNSGASILTVTTSNNTALGTYVLDVRGQGVGQTNDNSITLIVTTNTLAQPGTVLWTGAAADKTWNPAQNWTNVTASGNGTPGAANDLIFTNLGTVGTVSLTNNIVDATYAGLGGVIKSLQFANTNNAYHRTFIADGQTLMISNAVTGKALMAGTLTDCGTNANASVTAGITGANGELDIFAPNGFISASQGGNSSANTISAQQGILNLSGLGTMDATVSNLYVGARDGAGLITRASGVLYLAQQTTLTLTSVGTNALLISDNGSGNGSGTPSGLYLGLQNDISADAIIIGRQKATNGAFMVFNPAFTNQDPQVVIRGNSATRVPLYAVADASLLSTTQSSDATNDFSNGNVDILVDTMFVGRGAIGNTGAGNGILTFSEGTIDVNTLEAGYQNASTSAATGVINVNGPQAQLTVNGNLRLGHSVGGTALGTLNILNGGAAFVNQMVDDGGVSTVNVSGNGSTLGILTAAGTPAAPLDALNVTNATLAFNVDGSVTITNLVATTVNASGVTSIAINSVTNLSGTTTFPVISYAVLNGSVAANFVMGATPPGYNAILVDNSAQKRIDVTVSVAPPMVPVIGGISLAGTALSLSGSNGSPDTFYYVVSSTNVSLPLSNWTLVATNTFDDQGNFLWTNTVDPTVPQQFYLIQLP